MNTDPENKTKSLPRKRTVRAPQVLRLALAQLAAALETSGKDSLDALIAREHGKGYSEVIWLLEKVSTASLEWEEAKRPPPTANKIAGTSPETDRQLELKLQSME